MALILNESLVLAKTRSQDLKSVLKLNCWGSGIKDASLVRQLVNVEVIGLSSNEISTLEDFAYCPKLRELILRKNQIKNILEIAHLQKLPKLTSLWLGENPCAETTHNYRKVVLKALPNLTVLDNIPVSKEELREIEELGNEIYEEYEASNSPAPATVSERGSTSRPGADYEANDPQSTEYTYSNTEQQLPDTSCYQASEVYDTSFPTTNGQVNQFNEMQYTTSLTPKTSFGPSRIPSSNNHQSISLSSQSSVTALSACPLQWTNINNNVLPKGGKSRNGNILSAVLCLVKELDYVSCEVVKTALHCRMEETSQ